MRDLAKDHNLFETYLDFVRIMADIRYFGDETESAKEYWTMRNDLLYNTFNHNATPEGLIDFIFKSDNCLQVLQDALVDVEKGLVVGRSELAVIENPETSIIESATEDTIHPDYRRQGLGSLILAFRIAQAKEVGVEEMVFQYQNFNKGSIARMHKLNNAGMLFGVRDLRENFIEARLHPIYDFEEVYDALTNTTAGNGYKPVFL